MVPVTSFAPLVGSTFDWQAIDQTYDWVRTLRGQTTNFDLKNRGKFWTQDSKHHAEGNVWVHTRMVLDWLVNSAFWQALSSDHKQVLFSAALLHDVAKPYTWRETSQGISNHNHSLIGSNMARGILWRQGVDPLMREQVCALVAHHQKPLSVWFSEQAYAYSQVAKVSHECNIEHLMCLAYADVMGRTTVGQQQLLDSVQLFYLMAEELQCCNSPHGFVNHNTKLDVFTRETKTWPFVPVYDTTQENFTFTVMCGVAGSGKSHWIKQQSKSGGMIDSHVIVSLDQIRTQHNIKRNTKDEGTAKQIALQIARQALANGQSVVWDACNLVKRRRAPLLQLGLNYGARTQAVNVETSYNQVLNSNRNRDFPVPTEVLEAQASRWTPVSSTEVFQVFNVVN